MTKESWSNPNEDWKAYFGTRWEDVPKGPIEGEGLRIVYSPTFPEYDPERHRSTNPFVYRAEDFSYKWTESGEMGRTDRPNAQNHGPRPEHSVQSTTQRAKALIRTLVAAALTEVAIVLRDLATRIDPDA